jgi:hypothetical protein
MTQRVGLFLTPACSLTVAALLNLRLLTEQANRCTGNRDRQGQASRCTENRVMEQASCCLENRDRQEAGEQVNREEPRSLGSGREPQ